jgi:proline utilization trans-activator
LNRRYDAQRITWAEFEHRSKLWWTIYIIERKLSSLIGVPSALHDEDIALSMPPIDPAHRKDITVAFHVELSSQLGHILTGMVILILVSYTLCK